MRIAVVVLRAETDGLEEILHALLAAFDPVDLERRTDDLADRLARVQRRVGILEDHLHLAPQRSQLARRQLGDVAPVETDRAGGRVEEPQDQPGGRRLAAAGLPDDAQGLAPADVQGNVLDGVHLGLPASEDALFDREALGQVVELDKVVGGPVLRGHAASPRREIERFAPSRFLSSQDK